MSAFQAEYEGSIPLLRSRYRCSSGVEQQIHILWVIGSNPINGTRSLKYNTKIYRSVAEWFKAAVSKTAEVNSSEGSNPSRSAWILKCGVMVAQRIYTELLSEIKLSHNGNIKVRIL